MLQGGVRKKTSTERLRSSVSNTDTQRVRDMRTAGTDADSESWTTKLLQSAQISQGSCRGTPHMICSL
eukprot:2159745-Amphidinium_carterae.1